MGLPSFTNLDQYYADETQYGDYQYETLGNMVNSFMMLSQSPNFQLKNLNRNLVVYHAKKGVQQLYFDVVNEVIAVEYDLNPTLIIALPHDYLRYVRISWVDQNGKLHPMAMDKRNNLAQKYLQETDLSDFLYDGSGDIQKGDHTQDTGGIGPDVGDLASYDRLSGFTSVYQSRANYNLDLSKHFKNGSFRIDKTQGVIQFSSEVDEKTIVLEYISDGLFQRTDGDIKIHKFAEKALFHYIFYNLTVFSDIPQNRIDAAERRWWNERRIAKRRITPLNIYDVRQVLKNQSKWIKD